MLEMTLAELRKSSRFVEADDIVHIVDARKKEDVGYFVPKRFEKEFHIFLEKVAQKKRQNILKRVAAASRKDPIEDGMAGDSIGERRC